MWYGPWGRSFLPVCVRTRPVLGPFERYGGRTMVQSTPLDMIKRSIRAKSAYGFRRIHRTRLIRIQGRRPSIAETLTLTSRRTPASRIASSSARATSLITVVGQRPSETTIEMTASCPRTARRMSSRLRPSPWTPDVSPRTPANVSGRRVNAVIECPRRTPSSRTSLPVRPVEPITAMFRFGFCGSDGSALSKLMKRHTSSRGFGPALGATFDLGRLAPAVLRLPWTLHLGRPRLQEILANDIAVEVLRDDVVVLASELGQARRVVFQRL